MKNLARRFLAMGMAIVMALPSPMTALAEGVDFAQELSQVQDTSEKDVAVSDISIANIDNASALDISASESVDESVSDLDISETDTAEGGDSELIIIDDEGSDLSDVPVIDEDADWADEEILPDDSDIEADGNTVLPDGELSEEGEDTVDADPALLEEGEIEIPEIGEEEAEEDGLIFGEDEEMAQERRSLKTASTLRTPSQDDQTEYVVTFTCETGGEVQTVSVDSVAFEEYFDNDLGETKNACVIPLQNIIFELKIVGQIRYIDSEDFMILECVWADESGDTVDPVLLIYEPFTGKEVIYAETLENTNYEITVTMTEVEKETEEEIVLPQDAVSYIGFDGSSGFTDQYTEITEDFISGGGLGEALDKSWYVVKDGELNCNGELKIKEGKEVGLILCDGAKLTASSLSIPESSSLTICGQKEKSGSLVLSGGSVGADAVMNVGPVNLTLKTNYFVNAGTLAFSGTALNIEGTVLNNTGALKFSKASVKLSDGQIIHDDGNLQIENKTVISGNGSDVLILMNGGTAVLNDSTISGSYTYDPATQDTAANGCSGIRVLAGTFTMNSGTISHHTGHGVQVGAVGTSDFGKFILNGGSIVENRGYGVQIVSGEAAMYGGTIERNFYGVLVTNGASAQSGNEGSFTMEGGTVTGNKDTGIQVTEGGNIYMKGSPVVSGNGEVGGTGQMEVRLGHNRRIQVTGPFVKGSAWVGIRTDGISNMQSFTKGWLPHNRNIKPADVFFSTELEKLEDTMMVRSVSEELNDDNEAYLISKDAIEYVSKKGLKKRGIYCDVRTLAGRETAYMDGPEFNGITDGWYFVKVDTVLSNRIQIRGTVNLILGDGATLTCKNGLFVHDSNNSASLTIWVQEEATGRLIASNEHNDRAGIGGAKGDEAGDVTINGGYIKATGSKYGAGIGAGRNAKGGYITIDCITFTGSDGKQKTTKTDVWAYGGKYGAGIGGGQNRGTRPVRIYGGTVHATGGSEGAGIGGGEGGSQDNDIDIYGGEVYAQGGAYASGIGGGQESNGGGNGGDVYIFDGYVEARGGKDAAGIGGGEDGKGGNVYIYGGEVKAHGPSYAIGRGDDGGSQGSVSMPDHYMVRAGNGKWGSIERTFTDGEREAACHWREYAEVLPCTHGDWIYVDNGDNHTKKCPYCKYSVIENHDMDTITGYCVCGHGDDGGQKVAVYLHYVEDAYGAYRYAGSDSLQVMRHRVMLMPDYDTLVKQFTETPHEKINSEYYTFAGWSIQLNQVNYPNINVQKDEDLVRTGDPAQFALWEYHLYPRFEKKVRINIEPHGGAGSVETVEVTGSDIYTLPECRFGPPSEGMGFLGWSIGAYDVDRKFEYKQSRVLGDDNKRSPGFTLDVINSDFVEFNLYAEWGSEWEALQTRIDAAKDGDAISINKNITATDEDKDLTVKNKNITLNLNGYTLDRNADPDRGGRIFAISQGSSVVIRGGTLTGGYLGGYGSALNIGDADVTLRNVIIQGNTGWSCVSATEGSLLLDNVSFLRNTGFRPDNHLIYVHSGGDLKVQGKLTLSNNYPGADVFLPGDLNSDGVMDGRIYFTGKLTTSSPINVGFSTTDANGSGNYVPKPGQPIVFTSGMNGRGTAGQFVSLNEDYEIGETGDGEAFFGKPSTGITVRFAPGVEGGSGMMPDDMLIENRVDFVLPACGYTHPDGLMFAGWKMGDTSEYYEAGKTVAIKKEYFTKNTTNEIILTAMWGEEHDGIKFLAWYKTDKLPDEAGNYFLTGDVTLSSKWEVPGGRVNLCLFEKKITTTAQNVPIMTVPAGSELHIFDHDNQGRITGGKNDENAAGGAIYNSGKVTVHGGTITGNQAGEAGAIFNAAGAQLVILGGRFTRNKATHSQKGGGAIVNYGKMTMSGGMISGNIAPQNGGGIWNGKNGNSAEGDGTLILKGGDITGNTASCGGGIYFREGTFEISGSPYVVDNSITGSDGPNILLKSQNITNIMKVTGALTADARLLVSSDKSDATIPVTGGLMASGTDESIIEEIFESDKSGYKIGRDDDGEVFLGKTAVITFDHGDGASGSMDPVEVFVNAEYTLPGSTFTAPEGCGFLRWEVSGNGSSSVVSAEDGESITVKTDLTLKAVWTGKWAALQNWINHARSRAVFTLDGDVTALDTDGPMTVPAGKNVVIDLNGFKLDRAKSDPEKNGNAVTVYGQLTIRDNSADGGGRITGGFNDDTGKGGGVFVGRYGRLILNGGSIAGNRILFPSYDYSASYLSEGTGAGVYVDTLATFIQNGGCIEKNDVTEEDSMHALLGGGVFVAYGGTFDMRRGLIRANYADCGSAVYVEGGTFAMSGGSITDHGGYYAVYINGSLVHKEYEITPDPGTFTMSGGSIEGNHCTGVTLSDSSLAVSGSPVITENIKTDGSICNVLLYQEDDRINVGSDLADDAMIGVTKVAAGGSQNEEIVLTSGLFEKGSAENFTSDDAGYIVTENAEGEAILTKVENIIISGVTGSFDDKIKLNYYFDIPDYVLADEHAYITLTNNFNGKSINLPISSAALIDGKGRRFSIELVAKEASDTITARAFDGENNPLTIQGASGKDYTETGVEYSLMRYFNWLESSGPDKEKPIGAAARDYCSAAQIYFDYHKDGVSVSSAVDAVTADTLKDYVATREGTLPEGVSTDGLTAMLQTDNTLRLYFKFAEGVNPDSLTYTIDGETAVLHTRSTDGGRYLALENGVVSNKLGKSHVYEISDGTNTYTITASVLTYARSAAKKSNVNESNIGKTLYLYNQAAIKVFGP